MQSLNGLGRGSLYYFETNKLVRPLLGLVGVVADRSFHSCVVLFAFLSIK